MCTWNIVESGIENHKQTNIFNNIYNVYITLATKTYLLILWNQNYISDMAYLNYYNFLNCLLFSYKLLKKIDTQMKEDSKSYKTI
jgi:hypothetical protein